MKRAPRFLFRGEAVGVAAHIRRPYDLVIPVQASVSLPIIGGGGNSAVKRGRFGTLLNFDSAVVSTSADYESPKKAADYTHGKHQDNNLRTTTSVSTEVFNLSIDSRHRGSRGHTLTVARIAATMESTHQRRPRSQPSFTTRITLEGLAIDGHPFDVTFERGLLKIQTYKSLLAARAKFSALFEPPPRKGKECVALTGCSSFRPSRNCSTALAAAIRVISPNRVYVEDFGTIYLAEMIVSPVDLRLALLRIEMGSTVGGEVLIGGLGLDGHDWPP